MVQRTLTSPTVFIPNCANINKVHETLGEVRAAAGLNDRVAKSRVTVRPCPPTHIQWASRVAVEAALDFPRFARDLLHS